MTLFSVKEIANLLNIKTQDQRLLSKVYVDSRLCQKGGLYIALKGNKQDGHNFLKDASERGAIAALVQEGYIGPHFGLTLLPIQDPLKALQQLAKDIIELRKPKIIGVTGSVGKTTIKEFVFTLLEGSFQVDKTPDSYNGQIGLPLTILNAKQGAELLVLEMGISYPNEMQKLIDIAPVDVAVISHIASAHMGHFSSVEHIAEEKGIILSSPKLKQAFIHAKSKNLLIGKSVTLETYAIEEDVQLMRAYEPPFSETHFLENFSAAVHVAKYFNVSDEEIKVRAKLLKPFKHRFEKHVLQNYKDTILIDDTYNCNFAALQSVLQNLPKPSGQGKTLAVLGEMPELGVFSEEIHKNIGLFALPMIDVLICFGEKTKPLYEVFKTHNKIVYHTLDKQSIVEKVMHHLGEGDVLLCKGANVNRLWEVVEHLQKLL